MDEHDGKKSDEDSRMPDDLVEPVARAVSGLLVAEYRARHGQWDDLTDTVTAVTKAMQEIEEGRQRQGSRLNPLRDHTVADGKARKSSGSGQH